MKLHGTTRLKDDECYINTRTKQSASVGNNKLTTPGFKPKQTIKHYANELQDVAHYPKQYRNPYNYANLESQLQQSALTQFRQNKTLFTRPYLGCYMGEGTNTNNFKDIESILRTGEIAKISKANNLAGITIDRFSYLPECGYPQKLEHIVMDGIVRGGEATRDLVRRKVQIHKNLNNMLH